jgi:hypothetical protein
MNHGVKSQARRGPAQEPRHKYQMTRTADRKKFRRALHDAKDEGFDYTHRILSLMLD